MQTVKSKDIVVQFLPYLKKRMEKVLRIQQQIMDDTYSFDVEETITITADSIYKLMRKISYCTFTERSNSIQTDGEKLIGQHVYLRGWETEIAGSHSNVGVTADDDGKFFEYEDIGRQ